MRLLGGEPVLYRVIERVRQSALHGKVVVATSDHPRDDRILAWCEGAGVDCFRGSEADVLARYYHAAVAHDAEVIVRVTSDAPLLDPALLDTTIQTHWERNADYVLFERLPKGIPQETLSRRCLERSFREATAAAEREHVIYYALNHPEIFKVVLLDPPADLEFPHWRLTLDTEADYSLMTRLYEITRGAVATMSLGEIIALVRGDPDLLRLVEEAPP
jgi:spore coat polysaccharide biosynthesis protein SpsF